MHNLLLICLLCIVIPGRAALTWSQQEVTLNNIDINQQRDLLAFPVNSMVTAAPAFSEMVTVCRLSKAPLPVTPAELIIPHARIEAGETKNISSGSVTQTPVKLSVTEATNPATVTVFCSPLVKPEGTNIYLNGDNANIVVQGIELTIHYSSVPLGYLSPVAPTVDMGQCLAGGKLEKQLPLMVYFVGDNQPSGLREKITWNFVKDANNPDNSEPQVKHHGGEVRDLSLAFTQVKTDAGLSLLFSCQTPGSYTWTMNLTATPE